MIVLLVAAVLAAAGSASGDPSIGSKQAEARRVLAQLQELDASAQRANNAYQSATIRLRQLDRSLRINKQALHVARANLGQAEATLARRLVTIYTTRDAESTLAVLLGAQSIDDLVNRIETVQAVSQQDTAVIGEVISFKRQISQRERVLEHAHRLQRHLVSRRAAAKSRIAAQVQRAQALYTSIKGEIAHLIAMEHARQLAAARAARARLAAQQLQQRTALAQTSVGASAQVDGTSVAPPSQYGGVVNIAMRYLGTPYVWGGESPSGFDCSGFVAYVYAQVGVSLPHYAAAQWNYGVPVSRNDLEPGDLVFFDGLGHVGIYIGGNEFIHSPHTGDVVKISSLDEGFYAATYDGARRITG